MRAPKFSVLLALIGFAVNAVAGSGKLPDRPKGAVSRSAAQARVALAALSDPCSNTIQTAVLESIVPDAVVGNNTPDDLVRAILGPGVTFFNVTYTGVTNSAGGFSDSAAVFGITNGIVLSSGSIDNIKGPNLVDDVTQDNNAPGDADLDTLSTPYPSLDATVLEFDFVPTLDNVTFQYVFTSDEYNEWANSPFNDVFGFWINGTNVAVLPVTVTGTNVVSVNNVNGGNPLGTDPQNPQFYINNDITSGAPHCTEMDGFVVVLTATSQVQANQTNHIKLAIADASDHVLDSNVLIKGGSFSANHPPTAICRDHITLYGDNNCHVVVPPEVVDDGSGEIEDDGTITLAVSPTELWGEGPHSVVLSVTDTNGAIDYCLATVNVVCPRILDITHENDDIRITWKGVAGTNLLQVSPGSGSGSYSNNFSNLSGPVVLSNAPSGVITDYLDVGGATNRPSRFYRVRLAP